MCIICVELIKDKLTSQEAINNMIELIDDIDDQHIEEILELISKRRMREDEKK